MIRVPTITSLCCSRSSSVKCVVHHLKSQRSYLCNFLLNFFMSINITPRKDITRHLVSHSDIRRLLTSLGD